jgi:hypothetical protein
MAVRSKESIVVQSVTASVGVEFRQTYDRDKFPGNGAEFITYDKGSDAEGVVAINQSFTAATIHNGTPRDLHFVIVPNNTNDITLTAAGSTVALAPNQTFHVEGVVIPRLRFHPDGGGTVQIVLTGIA